MAITAGYDVGGAHLKVALAEDGRTIAVRQIACPLWRGLEQLDAALVEAVALIARAEQHAVTMTGELCELFPDRRTGVREILSHLATELDAGPSRLDGPARVRRYRDGDGRAGERRLDQLSRQRHTRRQAASPTRCSSTWARRRPTSSPLPAASRRRAASPTATRLVDGRARLHRPDAHRRQRRRPAGDLPRAVSNGSPRAALPTWPTCAASSASCRTASISTPRSTAAASRSQESVARFARCFGRDAGDAAADDWRACGTRDCRPANGRGSRRDTWTCWSRLGAAGRRADRRRRHRCAADRGARADARARVGALRHAGRCHARLRGMGDALRTRRRRRAAGAATPSAASARKAAIFSISQPQASSSRGPAVLEIAISRYFSSASIFSGGSILRRVTSTAHSSTAACARLKPSHGRLLASCTRRQE